MLREIFVLRVLKDEYSVVVEQVALEDKRDNLLATLEVIGGIGED